MNINNDTYIFYSTVTGTAERIAESVSKKYNIYEPIEIDEINKINKINKIEHLILIISTTRIGKAPESYHKFLNTYTLENYVIKNKINRISIIGLGDSRFSSFCQAGVDIYNKLIANKINASILKLDAKKNDQANNTIWEDYLTPYLGNNIFSKLIEIDNLDNLSHISDLYEQKGDEILEDIKLVLIKNIAIDTSDYIHHLIFEIKQNKKNIKPIDIIIKGRYYTVANYSDKYIDVFVNPVGKVSKYLCDMKINKSIKAKLSKHINFKNTDRYVVTGTALSVITRMLYDTDHVYNINNVMIGLRNKKIYNYYFKLFPYLSIIKSKIYYSDRKVNKKSNRITLNKVKRYFKTKDLNSIEIIGHQIS
jgi:flavodoxin